MSLFLVSVVPRSRPEAELDVLCRQMWAALPLEPVAVRTLRMAEGRVALFHFATGTGLIPAAEQLHVREAEGSLCRRCSRSGRRPGKWTATSPRWLPRQRQRLWSALACRLPPRWHRIEIPRRMLAPGRRLCRCSCSMTGPSVPSVYDHRRKTRLAGPEPALPSSVTHPLALDLIPGDERPRRTRFEGGVAVDEQGSLRGWVSATEHRGMELRVELCEGGQTIRMLATMPGSGPAGRLGRSPLILPN
jgi:hypothetical protein